MAKRRKSTGADSPMAIDERKWRARSDCDTLKTAAEITGDRSRLAAAKREAAQQQRSLAKIGKLAGRRI